jgi:hypothetical protein
MKTIIIFGLRRSGNHFVISMILQQYKNVVHINDVTLSYEKYKEYSMVDVSEQRSDDRYIGFKGADCVVISTENKNNFDELEKFKDEKEIYPVLLIRNPYNNLSSAWKIYEGFTVNVQEIHQLWPIYAHEFLYNNRFIKIVYDELCSDDRYIIDFLNKIDSNNIPVEKNQYILHQISSFSDNLAKKCGGSLSDCIYHNDPEFIKLFDDNIINELWRVILLR